MPPPRGNTSSSDGDKSARSAGPGQNPPLVIVSEQGRHSEASRRIVRAQAARASAAQSRETRARNRGDRHRETPQSPAESAPTPPLQVPPLPSPNTNTPNVQIPQPVQRQDSSQSQSQHQNEDQQQQGEQEKEDDGGALQPLANWIKNVLHLTANTFAASAAVLASTGRPQLANASEVLFTAGGMLADSGKAMEEVEVTGGSFSRRLPVALPKGFVNLQGKIQISDAFLVIISRTACFDFGSPGCENRLHELLFDIVMTSATASLTGSVQLGHPIQSHLRIACTCLTIFQGQRADGQAFAHDQKYNYGLRAAWDEAVKLDQDALREPNSAEASLWAVFIISVTCGATVSFFEQLIWGLMRDLHLQYWEQVRKVLIDFIYPGSFLDQPCQAFFNNLSGGLSEHGDQMITA